MAFGTVSREEHERALRQIRSLEGQLERLVQAERAAATAQQAVVALLERQVERETVRSDRLQAAYEAVQRDYAELKRHSIGALPRGALEASVKDPTADLGTHTKLAIDMFAAGDQELTRHLVAQARILTAQLKDTPDTYEPEALDRAVADLIMAGDTT